MTARVWAGASGYSFKEWKGSFYPERTRPEDMLACYAQRLPTVEINNTFYQMPRASVLEHWAEVVPVGFRFAIKAPRRITHEARLKADAAADPVAWLYKTLETLGDKRELGTIVATVFELAEKHGLVLAQAEYKLEFDKAGGFHTYQMRLPVRGTYPRLRGFVDATLARIACAALEDVDFKRDAIGTAEAEARLRFLFFVKDAAQ